MNPLAKLLLAVPLLASVISAHADTRWRIAPGVGIGHIKIGMEHSQVLHLLGTPYHQEDLGMTGRKGSIIATNGVRVDTPVLNGIIQDDWITPLPVPTTDESVDFMCDFLTIYFRGRRVVQIEERAGRFKTDTGLSIVSTANDFRIAYPQYERIFCQFPHPSNGGWPAMKHFVDFEDSPKAGIGWSYGAMGDLAPDPEPDEKVETVIVHAPGVPLLMDPDGGSRFIWKDAPIRQSGE